MTAKAAVPALSVVMPVYNALPHLDGAVESILGQTFDDFEFLILDDASTDGSTQRLQHWASNDPRIRLIKSKANLGPVGASRKVAEAASAPLVARMDADDISHPDRLRRQIDVLHAFPEVGLAASLYDLIDVRGRRIRGPDKWRLVRKSAMIPFPHDSILYRQEIFLRAGGYRDDSELWEDQDLITRISALSRIMVIPESLVQVRQTPTSTRSLAAADCQERALDSMYRRLSDSGERADDCKLDPRVFLSLGSVELWAGGRPRLLRRLLAKGRLSLDRKSLAAIGWTAWATASPATLRAALRLLGAIRNRAARRRFDPAKPVPWAPPGAAPIESPGTSIRKVRSGKASA